MPPFLSLIPSILVPPLSLSRRSTIASSFQSSFMPPGGEDLITRGEWRSLFFHPSPLQSTLLSIARATVLSFYPFPLPFSKVAVSRKPARSVFGPVFSYPFVQASRSRTNQVSRSIHGERINISSLIFEISSLYPESLTLYFQWNYFRNFRTIPRIRSLSQVSHDRLCPSSLEGEEEEEEVDGNFGGAYFSFRARKVNRATRLYPGSAHLEARA